ncbi:MAG TPA: four-helix bundle copper-binding protein [Tepidisphaeraceae bacterium]|jgi:hypothetical protein
MLHTISKPTITQEPSMTNISADMRDCIQNCTECHNICTETISHCLHRGGEHSQADHIRLMTDCAQICQIAADFMLRGSDLHSLTCGVCSEICALCAEDCERLTDDSRMTACAAVCRRCAESCQRMAHAAA